jgi:hypothetical protein
VGGAGDAVATAVADGSETVAACAVGVADASSAVGTAGALVGEGGAICCGVKVGLGAFVGGTDVAVACLASLPQPVVDTKTRTSSERRSIARLREPVCFGITRYS